MLLRSLLEICEPIYCFVCEKDGGTGLCWGVAVRFPEVVPLIRVLSKAVESERCPAGYVTTLRWWTCGHVCEHQRENRKEARKHSANLRTSQVQRREKFHMDPVSNITRWGVQWEVEEGIVWRGIARTFGFQATKTSQHSTSDRIHAQHLFTLRFSMRFLWSQRSSYQSMS